MRHVAGIVLLVFAVSCGDDGGRLLVDLRTDFLPIQEFIGAQLVVSSADGVEIARADHVPSEAADYVAGVRIAELPIEAAGALTVDATLVGLSGADLIARRTRIDFGGGNVGVTILITRDCLDVECSDPAAPACLGTRCVAGGCTPEDPSTCGMAECASDTDCAATSPCTTGRCDATGTCIFEGDDALCIGDEVCHPDDGCAASRAEDWWDPAWTRRRRVTFENGLRDEALSDFVAWVYVPEDATVGTVFIDGDGTLLAHERDFAADAWLGGAWVRVPEVDATSDRDYIWMYYGNPAADPPGSAADVWSAQYEAVWHLDPRLLDSTANGWDLRDDGTVGDVGPLGSNRSFDSSLPSQLRTLADDTSAMSIAQFTLSAWVLRENPPAPYQGVVTRPHDSREDRNEFYLAYIGENPFVEVTESGGAGVAATGPPSPRKVWEHITGTFDGGELLLYIDGVSVGQLPHSDPIVPGSRPIFLGVDTQTPTDPTGSTDRFDGHIDEVRIENVARSPAWIDAVHASETGSFVHVGSEER